MSVDNFVPDDSGKLCRGCNETLNEDDRKRGFFCMYCKGIAESHYTGFWSAFKMVKDFESFEYTGEFAIGEFATYLEADIGAEQRRWIKGFTSIEEVTVTLNALSGYHKGYVVSNTVTTLPHPVYVDSVSEVGRI